MVTVAIRSYGRLPQLIALVPLVLAQDYPDFEVVIIEQSRPEDRAKHRDGLNALGADGRVRLLEFSRLGPAGARNKAVELARGEILVFLDDDDIPVGTRWLADLARNFEDEHCIAVTGRQVDTEDEDPGPHTTWRAKRRCLRYSFFKMPRGYVRHGVRIQGVTQVAGSNAALRLEAVRRVGGWDLVDDHDEDSFALKFVSKRRPGEYFAYDPKPRIFRCLDVTGGIDRRSASASKRLRAELEFSHLVIARYFPGRFYAAYPVYLGLALQKAYHDVRRGLVPQPRIEAVTELFANFIPELRSVWRKARSGGAS
jgi:glycosyltransferase involved in cell wall biosynthesis